MEWKKLVLPATSNIRNALQTINDNASQLVMVIDDDFRLLGVVTDGNIRRSLLDGATVDTTIDKVMNTCPIIVDSTVSAEQALVKMQERDITLLPCLDEAGTILWVWSKQELESKQPLPNSVVIMAGGLGSRLKQLTQKTPKPMLTISGKPILEIILNNYIDVGFHTFYFAVNYLADQIESYFGDGTKFGCEIHYLKEHKRLGTAGALSLVPPQKYPFLVTNADLLTPFNLRTLLIHHITMKAEATMLIKSFSYTIPYGVVESDKMGRLLAIREKPKTSYHVVAGMYAFEPSVLEYIPSDQFFDMPDLFAKLQQDGRDAFVMETEHYWLDIGRPEDFEKAQSEFL